jgi:predicted kinase
MKTAFNIAVTGSINSGKSTLALRIANELGALLLASDSIRAELPASRRGLGECVFATMRQRFERALADRTPVVLDSTGMSPRFRAMLHAHRAELYHVHLRLERTERFEERERRRTDRADRCVPRLAFLHSCRVQFQEPPDRIIATDDLTAQEVFGAALGPS